MSSGPRIERRAAFLVYGRWLAGGNTSRYNWRFLPNRDSHLYWEVVQR